MQIIFAAPFLLAAGLVFTVLSLIPRARRWAIPIPTGILAAAPCLVLAISVEIPLDGAARGPTPNPWHGWLIFAAVAGIAGGLIAGFIAWPFTASLPKVLLRAAVFIAGWCSYLVLLFAAAMTGSYFGWPHRDELIVLILEALLSFIGAYFIAQRSEDFRPRQLRLPWGTAFRKRSEESAESPTEQSRA